MNRTLSRSRLRIRQRRKAFSGLLKVVRGLIMLVLAVGLAWGGYRWLTGSQVEALEFTPHKIGDVGDAKGVQDFLVYDFDGDGKNDIVTAGLDGVSLYKNQGKFVFIKETLESAAAQMVRLSDINNDGEKDIVAVLNNGDSKIRWFKHNSGFDFSEKTVGGSGTDMVVVVSDLTGDKLPEIVSASKTPDGLIELRLWANTAGVFNTGTVLLADSKVTALASADLDHNGTKDILTGGTGGLQQWRSSDSGVTWARSDIDDQHTKQTFLAIGDPNTGGTWILALAKNGQRVDFYRSGSGDEKYKYGYKAIDTGSIDVTCGAFADLNGDGKLDMVVTGQDNNNVYWFQNDGHENFARQTLATGLQSVAGVAVGDIGGNSDLDIVTGDLMRGQVYVYERVTTKPIAETPPNIEQATNASGQIAFSTKIINPDRRSTRLRVEYTTNGTAWHKPRLVSASPSAGTVDLNNNATDQIGTSNAIDTDTNESVTLSILWDTKSTLNGGGAINGDAAKVRLRFTPIDSRLTGTAAVTGSFRVDNEAPKNVTGLQVTETDTGQATLSWASATDSSSPTFEIAYGTNLDKVSSKTSNIWGASKDADMGQSDKAGTTITSLANANTYYFRLFATDAFGNVASSNIVNSLIGAPTATDSPAAEASASPEATASPEESMVLESPLPAVSVSPLETAPPVTTEFNTLTGNQAPVADVGSGQIVSAGAPVVLNGSSSYDPDEADNTALTYSWRQVSGPFVKILGDRTSRASIVAGNANETYIFSLTVRDAKGASATDFITVAIKEGAPLLPPLARVLVTSVVPTARPGAPVTTDNAGAEAIAMLLMPPDIALFILALVSTCLMLAGKFGRSVSGAVLKKDSGTAAAGPQGRVVHYRTGSPVVGSQVLIYDVTGKLRATERVNQQGFFPTYFPPGQYTLTVQAPGFAMAEAARAVAPANGILYSGGKITVTNQNEALNIVIAMKPTGQEVGSVKVQALQSWQTIQRLGRMLSWPLFIAGALLNSVLVFIAPSALFITLEVLYMLLIVFKLMLEWKVQPAYGQVRDAVTHVPVDLAVVRLLEQGTNRLIMTRVTNNQGKFFALPPSGTYVVTITKPGYASFSKDNVTITSSRDTVLQMVADLMPLVPQRSPGLTPLSSLA